MATFTFVNSTGLSIPDAASTHQYMQVFGLGGAVTGVAVTLTGLTHTLSEDLEMLLTSPDPIRNLEFWSDVGSADDLNGNYVVSDTASTSLPDGTGIVPGTYKPADYDGVETGADFGLDGIPITHAGPNGSGTFASAFGSIDGNGGWGLFIKDSIARDVGHLNGWGVTITTDSAVADVVGTLQNDVIRVNASTANSGTYSVSILGTASYSGAAFIIISGDYGDIVLDLECGNDLITAGLQKIYSASGDVKYVNGAGITGGDDVMTLTANDLFGDAYGISGGTLAGGDDIITAGLGTGAVYGDASSVNNGGFIVGGNDSITVSGGTSVYGDASFIAGTSSHVSGGDDIIAAIGNEANSIFGDSESVLASSALVGGNDTIRGGGGNDSIYGDWRYINAAFATGGNDKLYGDAGSDTIYGNEGNDLLDGGADLDMLVGGSGNDIYVVDNGGDVVDESVGGSNGVDTVMSSVLSIDLTNTTLFKGPIENATLAGTLALNLTGSAINNTLLGNAGKNAIDGKAGADTMRGLGGDDTYIVDTGADRVIEAAGQGTDTIAAMVSYTLQAGQSVETVYLSSLASAFNLNGNELANALYGNAGANRLSGGVGNDLLVGGTGQDLLAGGANSDIFRFDALVQSGIGAVAADRVTDFTAGDRIAVSRIDANALMAGDQAFVLDAGGAFLAGEIHQTRVGADLLLDFNVDADAAAEMSILVLNHGLLGSGDFVL